MALHSRPALSNADKYLGARTAEILQPSFDRFSLPMASTGCRHGATAPAAAQMQIDRTSIMLLIKIDQSVIVALLLIYNVFEC